MVTAQDAIMRAEVPRTSTRQSSATQHTIQQNLILGPVTLGSQLIRIGNTDQRCKRACLVTALKPTVTFGFNTHAVGRVRNEVVQGS